MVGRFIEITFLLVLAYLVIANAGGFSTAIGSFASAYGNVVRVLQGR